MKFTSTKNLIKRIKHCIQNGLPLSVVRCGDGEFHLIKNASDFKTPGHLKVHYGSINVILKRNKIWECPNHPGNVDRSTKKPCSCFLKKYENDPVALKWKDMMKAYVIDAIKNSNYVGLNVPNKLEAFYGIDESILQRHGVNTDVLVNIDSLFSRSKDFATLPKMRQMIDGNDVHIITNNVKAFIDTGISKKLGCNVTFTDISSDRAYKLRDVIKQDISKTDAKIILFGGGGAIKDLIPWAAKNYGKVAIDVGSVLDPWSGTPSRIMYDKPEMNYVKWVQ